ncbi:MAG: alpha-ribazole phosphatase [Thermodesulfobacteriota bacterium]|nr:alpha-ribazole phosphatase [Thermodesulfobacteriota bacterium]
MTTLYLLRHGAIEGNDEKRFVGQIDPPLSEKGRQQAKTWHQRLKDDEFSMVLCSDLQRARETAALVCLGWRDTVRMSADLREIHLGEWDGVAMAQIRKQFPELWRARGEDFGGFRPPGGESFADLQQRVVPVVENITNQTKGKVLLITHAGVIRVLLCHVLQMPLSILFQIHLDYGALTIIEYKNYTPQVKAVNLGPVNIAFIKIINL